MRWFASDRTALAAVPVTAILLTLGACADNRSFELETPAPPSAAAARGSRAPAGGDWEGRSEPPRLEWQSSVSYQADGPHPVDLSLVPAGVYDPNNKLDTGRFGGRIDSPLPEEEQERLRQEALLLPPSFNVQQMAPGLAGPAAGASFDSIDFTECCGGGGNVPPDPEIAVGPNHVIAVVNVAFEIYDKTGTSLVGPTTLSSFFAGTPGCSSTGVFDPNVLYDEEADRFVLGIDGDGTDYCVAASTGPDPTGTWNRYGFPTDIGGAFFDYPHAGVGVDAIFMGSNQFSPIGPFLEGRVFAMDKAAMYAGLSLSVVSRSTGSDGTPQPANLHGFGQGTWPSSGPHYIMTELFDGANHTVWSWEDPFGANVLTRLADLNLNAATGVTAGFPVDVPQAGSGAQLQANDWRGLDTEYRNGFLWMTNTISCNPGGGTVNCVRWAQIDPTGPSVVQAGVFSSNDEYRFFPDLAVNHCDDMTVGYTKSGSSIFPGVYVTGRESGDPAGTLQSEVEVRAGDGAYTAFDGTPHRWGDYTGMTIDPDGQTFWYLGEYSKNTGDPSGEWGTFIGSFQYAACAGGNTAPTVAITAPTDGSSFDVGELIDLAGTASDTEDGDLTGDLSWTSSIDGAIGSGGSFSTTLSSGTHTITASVTDSGGLDGSDTITVTVNVPNTAPTVTITAPPDGSVFDDIEVIDFDGTASDAEEGDLSASLSWSSSLDGALGTGASIATTLSAGTHTITASVTDSGGLSDSDSISVTVDSTGGTVTLTLESIGAEDGVVGESSESSDVGGPTNSTASFPMALRVGDLVGDRQMKAILSFDTSQIPDGAAIVAADLRLRRGGRFGTNPFETHGPMLVDVRSGSFSDDPALESSDFQAAATATAVASLSDAPSNLDYSEGSLDAAGRAAIDDTGTTQFRLYFQLDDNDDGGSDLIGYYSGEAPVAENRPQLIVQYATDGNALPVVTIDSPTDGATFAETDPVDFSGSATDSEDGDVTASLVWTSSLDGTIGNGGSFSTSSLSTGTHTVTATATDSMGAEGSASISITILGNVAPTATITAPPDGSSFVDGTSIAFAATASDPEDGDLSAGLAWASSLDGSIGVGAGFSTTLSVGVHTITASVTDSGGLPGADSISVTVNPVGGTTTVTFTSIASEDGMIGESSETSDVGGGSSASGSGGGALRVGDFPGDRQVKTIVSFDTSTIPAGATIVSATLRLRRGMQFGGNPFSTLGACLVDAQTGGFGGDTAFAASDFQAAATAVGVATLSDAPANGDWSEGDLDAAGLAAINDAGTTQLRVYFAIDDNDNGAQDTLGYFSGDNADPANHPQLVVTYQE